MAKKIIAILGSVVLVACHHRPDVVLPIPAVSPAAQKPLVTPTLSDAQADDNAANQKAAVISRQLQEAQKRLSEARKDLSETRTQVDVMRKAKTNTEKEWDALVAQLTKTEDKVSLLELSHSQTLEDLRNEQMLRESVSRKLQTAMTQAADKQAEADQLRSQLKYQQDVSVAMKKSADDATRIANDNAAAADNARGQIKTMNRVIYVLSGLLLLASAGCLVLAKLAFRW